MMVKSSDYDSKKMFEDASALIAVETQLFPIVVMWDTLMPNSLCYRGMAASRS